MSTAKLTRKIAYQKLFRQDMALDAAYKVPTANEKTLSRNLVTVDCGSRK